MGIRSLVIPVISSLGLLISQASVAGENDDWQYEITPFLLASGLDGEIGFHGVTAEVDASFSDIMDNLDSAFMGLFTAQKGRWTYGLEGIYSKLEGQGSQSVSGPGGRVDINGALDIANEMSIYSGTVAYRVLDDKTKLDVLGAIRYTKFELDADVVITTAFAGGSPFRNSARSYSGSESWTDAVIGVRAIHPVSEDIDLLGYIDVGGGGSDNTYQAIAGVNWEFKEDYTAKLGYRVLDWDYEDGAKEWDMSMHGLYFGLGIRF